MTDGRPTEVLGDSINAWDKFYRSNFKWVYQYSLDVCHNTLKAKELTDRLFVKVLLSHPEYIVENDEEALKAELGILFPYFKIRADITKELSAGRLLHMYYQPN